MSKIWVDRIEAMAKRRLARTAQVEAMPPQPERLNANLWHLNRRSWIHGRYPGLMSRDTGHDLPAKQMLAQDKAIQSMVLEQFSGYTLEQLLIMPELPSEIQLAIREQVAYYDASGSLDKLLATFKPAGYSIDSEAAFEPGMTFRGGPLKISGPPIPAPCIIREARWTMGNPEAPGFGLIFQKLGIEGYGILHHTETAAFYPQQQVGGTARGLDRWVISGAVIPFLEYDSSLAATYRCIERAQVSVVCEPLIRTS